MMFAQFHSNAPTNLNSLVGLCWAPWQMALQMQYQFYNAATLGMLDDIAGEFEHALVEGKEITENFVEDIVALQRSTISDSQKHLMAQTTLDNAEGQLKHIAEELLQNILFMPWLRATGRPSRKRFPVTLEGQLADD